MKTIIIQEPMNLKVVRFELDFTELNNPISKPEKKRRQIKIPKVVYKKKRAIPSPPIKNSQQKRDTKELVEDLLDELYAHARDWSGNSLIEYSQGSTQAASTTSSLSNCGDHTDAIERSYLEALDIGELHEKMTEYTTLLQITGERLARSVRMRDRLRRKQKRLCAAFTVLLRHISIIDLL